MTFSLRFTRRGFVLLALASAALSASADDLTTTSGKKLNGKLVAVDAQGVTFASGEAKVKIPGKDIVGINLGNKVSPVPKDTGSGKSLKVTEVELTDGSVFRLAKFGMKGKKIEAEFFPGPMGVTSPTFEPPMTALFSVMRDAEDSKLRESWKKMLASRGKRDMYVIREGDTLNFVQGTVLGATEDGREIEFEKDDGKQARLLMRAATGGFVFAQPVPAQIPQTLCKVVDVFGNTILAQSIELGSSGITVKSVAGVEIKYASPQAIVKLDYAEGNVAYLSDLEPQVNAPQIPADEKGLRVNVESAVLRDRGISDEPLKLGNEVFAKGLVIAPDSVVTYTINGDYREFKAMLGLPDSIQDGDLQAKVTIEADGRVLFSEGIKRKEKPRGISLDVKGVKTLRLIVEGDYMVNGNRVIVADARVQK